VKTFAKFHAVFNTEPGVAMYLPSGERVLTWWFVRKQNEWVAKHGDMQKMLTDRPDIQGCLYRRWLMFVAICFISLGLSTCAGLGPASISTDRGSYIDILSLTDKQELLSNIVRVKYTDPPVFLQVNSITASPSLEIGSESEFKVGGGDIPPPLAILKPKIIYDDNPTISYTPLSGKQFANELLVPFTLTPVFLMLNNGFDFSVVAELMFVSMNGLSNSRNAAPEERERFRKTVTALGRLGQRRLIRVGTRGGSLSNGEGRVILTVDPGALETEEGKQVFAALGIAPSAREIEVRLGLSADENTIAIRTRSLLAMISYLSNFVETPEAHAAFVWPSSAGSKETWPIRIKTSRREPAIAYTSVHFNDQWFFVEADDLASQNILYLLRILFNLQAQANTADAPKLQLTLPVR